VTDVRLIYGLGATKAGSGWLYRYLRAHPECHLRTLKELHFFDTVEFGLTAARLRKINRNIGLLQGRLAVQPRVGRMIQDFHDWLPVAKSGDHAAYLRYLTDGRGERRVVADITPGYSRLSQVTLGKMAGLLPDTRFVFFMRDPVARLWSHVRMLARSAMAFGSDAVLAAGQVLDQVLSEVESSVLSRGAYDVILPRLKSVVPEARLHVDFFEETVLTGAVAKLCAFLGIAPRPANERRYHEGIALPIARDQRRRMRAVLAPQYEYARREMGRLPAAWEASLAKD
jgi:Sulfotransferase family